MNILSLFDKKAPTQVTCTLTIEQMMEDMRPKGTVWVMGSPTRSVGYWKCQYEATDRGIKIEINGDPSNSLYETVFSCYNKMHALRILP